MEPEPQSQPEPSATPVAAEAEEQPQEEDGTELLTDKAMGLINKITSNPDNPSPTVLHALSTLLEAEEARYIEDAVPSTTNNGRSSHNVGRLGTLIRDHDEFFELISSKFLTESRYSVSVQAATTRLLYSCSLTWTYPHVFEGEALTVLDKLKGWAMDETPRSSSEDHIWKNDTGKRNTSDFDMLRTYSTGLLAVCLTFGGQLVEELLDGLSAKLMRYLRYRVLGESSMNQRDSNQVLENRNSSTAYSKTGDEVRGRLHQVTESSYSDVGTLRIHANERDRERDPSLLGDFDKDRERRGTKKKRGDECWVDDETPDGVDLNTDGYVAEPDGEENCNTREYRDSKTKPTGRPHREEDSEENMREDSSRRRTNRGIFKSRAKTRSYEGAPEYEQALTSPGSANRLGPARSSKDRTAARTQDLKRASDAKKGFVGNNSDSFILERDDNDECFQGCKVGSKDITDLVKKAVRAAEEEARAANAPAAAIRAAGDDAAEVVKTSALEEYRKTNDEDAAVHAASRAASTVIEAANTVALSSNSSNVDGDSGHSKAMEIETTEDTDEYTIIGSDSLAKLRERFCIQCLIMLGEYVEALGPVLKERGVDVCLTLLQRCVKNKEASNVAFLLPDILRLICALAAHKKFAQVFVDRGGMQKLLAAPRNTHTFLGLSSCLFTIGSNQGVMERICDYPSNIVHQVVELALQLIECPQDHQARKNAALFFAAAFVFRAVIDAFDSQDGLQKLLSVLHYAASVRSGVPSGSLSTSGALRNDQSPADVLTSMGKQIAYHTCVALRQYFRAHMLSHVDSVRPSKNLRSAQRNFSSVKPANKSRDISNEAMDAVFRQIQKDRKLGPALVRARWPVVHKFISLNGHITMLELCQAPPVDRYLHDLLQYALGVLQIVTIDLYGRKCFLNATLSNDRVGVAVILDAANGAGYVEPEIVVPALSLLINLVCAPPSISNKPSNIMPSQQASSTQTGSGSVLESRDRNTENMPESRERTGEPTSVNRGVSSSSVGNTSSTASTVASGLVGDRRISLGTGAGCVSLAAQLEQCYLQAREAVRANNGIKVLLQLLQPRMVTPPTFLDCIRALTCRVLLGLARDDTIAHILTKLQVGKKLSELIRDSGSQTTGGEQNRWQTELTQVAIELIGIVTNSGRASTLAASDAATPTLRRIERAAIAAATPISYHPRELLLLIHEHLQASGLANSAATLLKEAQLTALPSLAAPSSLANQVSGQEASSIQIQWPSGRAACGFLSDKTKVSPYQEDSGVRSDLAVLLSKKKSLASSAVSSHSKVLPKVEDSPMISNSHVNPSQKASVASDVAGTPSVSAAKSGGNMDSQMRTPIVLPMKRKLTDLKEIGSAPFAKRLNAGEHTLKSPSFTTPIALRRSGLQLDATPSYTPKDYHAQLAPNVLSADGNENQLTNSQHGLNDPQPTGSERMTLDSLVVQYLKHQHRQCPAPITTLPPLSLLHPHVCPEPRRSLDAPSNVTARLSSREFRSKHGGIHGGRKDRQFVYSRFRPWRTCRGEAGALLTCVSFLGDSSRVAAGGHSGELKVFDTNSNTVVESYTCHQSPLTLLQSHISGENHLLLSSSVNDVRLWDASSVAGGPRHSFDNIKAARFSNSGATFAALRSESSQREILLYDAQTCQLDLTLTDTSNSLSGRGHAYSLVHFSPSDSMLLWNGVLWDRRGSGPIHRFDQFSDYGGGGFHPAGNEVIINSEVWDLRNFRLLRSVPSLDQTVITFNASGDVIYATLRRNLEDVMSAFNGRRVKHPLFSAFRTVDAVNYSDIATTPVDRCVLDFATEPTDSFVGLITMDDQDEMYSSARVYEIGRRKPTDDDSDPDDAETDEEDEDDGDDDDSVEAELGEDGDSDSDDEGNDDVDGASDFDDDDDDDDEAAMADFMMGGDSGFLELVTEGDEDDEDGADFYSSGDEDDFL